MSVTDLPFEKSISIEYNTDLFEAETIKRMMAHYCNLLQGIIIDPLQSTARLPMLHETERHQLLVEWNKTLREFPEHTCIHDLIEAQVQATPDKIALSFEDQNLTYAQMNVKANQLAHFLLKKGVKADTPVGIHLPRSLDLVIAVLGILKTGAFFVPLDPSYPALRLVFMIADWAQPSCSANQTLRGRLLNRISKLFFSIKKKSKYP